MTQESDKYFGNAVRVHREAKGWSKTEFAERLSKAGLANFHPTTITRMESGVRPTRLNEAAVIARVLEHSLDALVRFEFAHDRLDEAIRAYDLACKGVAVYEGLAAATLEQAEAERSFLEAELLDNVMPEEARSRSIAVIQRLQSYIAMDRIEYWREVHPDISDDEMFDFMFDVAERIGKSGDSYDSDHD